MPSSIKLPLISFVGLALALAACSGGGSSTSPHVTPTSSPSAGPVTIAEYPVPANTALLTTPACPWGITTGSDKGVWFVYNCGLPATLGRIDPTSHAIVNYVAAEPSPSPMVNCGYGLASGTDGGLWGAYDCGTVGVNNDGGFGRFDPVTHAIEQFPLLGGYACPNNMVQGPDGRMWFTLQCNPGVTGVGAIVEATGAITTYPFPSGLACASSQTPFGMTVGPDGNMWVGIYNFGCTGQGQQGYLASIVPSSGTYTLYPIPAGTYGCPWGLTTGPDKALWYTLVCNPGGIGRYDPVKKAFSTYAVPTANSQPRSIVLGSDGALWFAEYTAGKIGRITTAGVVTEYLLPTPTGVEGMTLGPDGAVWFTEDANNIGRIK